MAGAAAWAAAITLGAVLLHYFPPGRGWVARAANSEAVHVVAHLLLYGTLTLLGLRASGVRAALAVAATVATGALQEGAQTVLFGIRPGRPELFDLTVDLAAALTVVVLFRARAARVARC